MEAKWDDLPVEIQEKMLEHQEKQTGKRKPEAFKSFIRASNVPKYGGFSWQESPEGFYFWEDVIENSNFQKFYDLYPKLPGKWCVSITRDKEVYDWFNKNSQTGDHNYHQWKKGYLHYPYFNGRNGDKCHQTDKVMEGYTEISVNDFYKWVLNKKQNSKMVTLKRAQVVDAHNKFSCDKWKDTIIDLLKANPTVRDDEDIAIPKRILDMISKEATRAQQAYAKSLGIFERDRNAFKKKFDVSDIEDVSEKLFGDKGALQILNKAVPDGKEELVGKAFYVQGDYEVSTGAAMSGTYITIFEKE